VRRTHAGRLATLSLLEPRHFMTADNEHKRPRQMMYIYLFDSLYIFLAWAGAYYAVRQSRAKVDNKLSTSRLFHIYNACFVVGFAIKQ